MTQNHIIRYWGRKPLELAHKYINLYSKPGDIVADMFGGSGVFVEVALKLGRKAIYIDLNPFAELIAHSLISGCNISEYEKAVQKILSRETIKVKMKDKYVFLEPSKLFHVKCSCKRNEEARSIIFTRVYQVRSKDCNELDGIKEKIVRTIQSKRNITHEELCEVYKDVSTQVFSNAVKRLVKQGVIYEKEVPITAHLSKPCKCNRTKIDFKNGNVWTIKGPFKSCYWYPADSLDYGNGKPFLKKRDASQVNEFFMDRSLALLSIIWYDIRRLKLDEQTKRCLRLTFMTTLARSSKMCRNSGGTWPINSYWIPRNFVVKNPYVVFKNAAHQMIQFLRTTSNFTSSDFSDVIYSDADAAFQVADSTKISLPEDSLDYAIIDPPHTDEAQFFELSVFYTSWLGVKLNFERELIINPKQGKNLENYLSMLKQAAEKIEYALKCDRYFTIILHEEDQNVLDQCAKALQCTHLKLIKKEQMGDYFIYTFKKQNS